MITKSDLANRIADQLGTSRAAADRYLSAVLNAIEHAVEHEGGVAIPRFGTFALKTRPERTARNPRTGESVTVKASSSWHFKPSKTLKREID